MSFILYYERTVKQVIQGTTYDTETATELTGGDNIPNSNAWWALYRTQQGAFFKIVVDHDGSTFNEFRPLTDAEARAVLEKHANHLVEIYFGPMPEASSMRFKAYPLPSGAARIVHNTSLP